jgi:CRP-like cAMP-binding protein
VVGSTHSLKSLPSFERLTAAESAVFERELEERTYQAGESVAFDEALMVVREGNLRLQVETPEGLLPFASTEGGGLLGEMAFFEPRPVSVLAVAESDSICLAIDRPSLMNTFRYSRTGAVKFMASFARSMSSKLRSANDVLQSAASRDSAEALRPSQLDRMDLKHLMVLAASRSYEKEAVLFNEGDAGGELYVIEEGEVEILKEESSGNPISLARLGRGDFFGEMAFVDERPRSATAVARSALHVHVLPSGSIEKAFEYNVGVALYLTSVICKIMARRLNVTLKRIGAR